MQFVMNKCFFLNAEKKFGAGLSCRFREKRKNCSTPTHPIPKKRRHRAEG